MYNLTICLTRDLLAADVSIQLNDHTSIFKYPQLW